MEATAEATPSAESTPTATSTPESASTAPFTPPTEPDADAAFEHIRVLAGDIGIRSAGTPEERQAAEYIRDQLESYGYAAEIEPFEVDSPRDESTLDLGDGSSVRVFAMTGSPEGAVEARLVPAGLGRPEEFEGLDVSGAIALLERGDIEFRLKAQNAEAAGAAAVIVVNSERGAFRGALGNASVGIPVVAVAGEDAATLEAAAAAGDPVSLEVRLLDEPFESWNVVARPSDAPCTAYLGSHYDSVPAGPGANDNASGTAAVLELARTHRVPGLCVLTFGSEEIGLFGSRAFVSSHDLSDVRFMLNLDMVSKLTGPEFVASPTAESQALADRASAIATTVGLDIPRGSFPPFASSDHASFAEVGVPAITMWSGDDEFIHTANDNLENSSVEDLATMLRAGSAVLRELLASEG
ncbi:MAG: M20/M25/M40 family metallo-hydrolase [Dehalococcoidia bacterium]